MVKNPISRAIVDNYAFNKFEDYLPVISKMERGWLVAARLQDNYYQKWYPHISSNEKFRVRIFEKIKSVAMPHITNSRQHLKIIWLQSGAYFQCEGDDCSIGVDDRGHSYSPHNIDNHIQATILFLALAVYLPSLYFVMEMLESGEMKVEDWPNDQDFFKFPHTVNIIKP